jgi:periplasmic mercuric ion binding protein
MKTIFASILLASALVFTARAADVSTTLSDVHICCGSCVKGVAAAIAKAPGAKAVADEDASTVVVTGSDVATVQKGVNALTDAGFFGKSSNADIKVNADTGAMNMKVQSLKIDDLHLCCGKCVKAVNEILATVPGVKANTAAKGAKSFTVTGDFNDKDVFDALQKGGLTGHVEK